MPGASIQTVACLTPALYLTQAACPSHAHSRTIIIYVSLILSVLSRHYETLFDCTMNSFKVQSVKQQCLAQVLDACICVPVHLCLSVCLYVYLCLSASVYVVIAN